MLCGTDRLSALLVRNKTYPVGWDYSGWNFILESGFIGEEKVKISLRVLNSIAYCRYALTILILLQQPNL